MVKRRGIDNGEGKKKAESTILRRQAEKGHTQKGCAGLPEPRTGRGGKEGGPTMDEEKVEQNNYADRPDALAVCSARRKGVRRPQAG